jgi:hypothetical protein
MGVSNSGRGMEFSVFCNRFDISYGHRRLATTDRDATYDGVRQGDNPDD